MLLLSVCWNQPRLLATKCLVIYCCQDWLVTTSILHGRPHIGANGVSLPPPWKNGWKIKKWKHAKNSSFICLCYILRAITAVRCRKWCYADHIFIQIYFRMHHSFVVRFSKLFSPQVASGHWPPNQNSADVPGILQWLLLTLSGLLQQDLSFSVPYIHISFHLLAQSQHQLVILY